ncbi:MAG TPA: hypothetical protein VLA05_10495 [Coriobacteriia bacterium]|nr:hypothetical protein [Coriobacteriia bacterium]
MTDTTIAPAETPRRNRFTPLAGTRIQLVSAAMMWLIGSTILTVRGISYVQGRYWHAWALAAALAIGVLKSRYLLDRIAKEAVARIRRRGRSCYFGFFSWRSWLLLAIMMGGGITLRNLIVQPGVIGAGIMGAIYLGIGAALFFADRIFWRSVVEEFSEPTPENFVA